MKSELVEIKNVTYFSDNSFKNKISSTHQVFNDSFIGYPVRVNLIDSLLFVADMKTDSVLHLFSANSKNHIGLFIPRGNGPAELLSCADITRSNNPGYFWAFDITSRKWIEYNINNLITNNRGKYNSIIDFNKIKSDFTGINQPEWLSDSTFIFNSLFKYNERFFILDKNLNLKKAVYNPSIKVNNKFPENILGDIFSSFISVKPDKSKIATVGRYLDLIEIYDANGNLLNMLKGPDKDFDFKFDIENSLQQGAMLKLPETKRAYTGIKTTNNYIYLLYSGKERKDPNNYSYSTVIYTVNWNGEPIKKYELDVPVSSFEIDEEKNIIYALHQDAYVITYTM